MVPDGDIYQELLPFSPAFGLLGKQLWVYTKEEYNAIRIQARRAPNPVNDPVGNKQEVKTRWSMMKDVIMTGGMTTVKTTNLCSTSSSSSTTTTTRSSPHAAKSGI